MKTMPNPEEAIMNMKTTKREIDKNLDIYHRYQRFKKMMGVYDRQQRSKTIVNLLKINDPTVSLANFFKIEGLNEAKDIEDYKIYKNKIDQMGKDRPEIDLTDITSRESRKAIIEILNELDPEKQIFPVDFEFVAMIEGYGLYNAIAEIQAGQDRDAARMRYGLTEEMLQKGEERKLRFDQGSTKKIYDSMEKNSEEEETYLIAAVLELGMGDANTNLKRFEKQPIKIKAAEEEITEDCLLVNPKKPDFYVIEGYSKSLNNYAPSKENTQRVEKLIQDYLAGIKKYNEARENAEREYRRNHDGKPSPNFLKELEEYKKGKDKKQRTQEQNDTKQEERDA